MATEFITMYSYVTIVSVSLMIWDSYIAHLLQDG